jgi:hypothetical protein
LRRAQQIVTGGHQHGTSNRASSPENRFSVRLFLTAIASAFRCPIRTTIAPRDASGGDGFSVRNGSDCGCTAPGWQLAPLSVTGMVTHAGGRTIGTASTTGGKQPAAAKREGRWGLNLWIGTGLLNSDGF